MVQQEFLRASIRLVFTDSMCRCTTIQNLQRGDAGSVFGVGFFLLRCQKKGSTMDERRDAATNQAVLLAGKIRYACPATLRGPAGQQSLQEFYRALSDHESFFTFLCGVTLGPAGFSEHALKEKLKIYICMQKQYFYGCSINNPRRRNVHS